MAGRLEGKVALVTGAGAVGEGWGNGKATAVLFAREGASVFAVDINPAAAEATREIIEGEGGKCVAHTADVTDAGEVEAMVAACVDAFGRIDILHNNVGGSAPGGPVEMSEEAWRTQMDHNLTHVFLTLKQVLPLMEGQGGGAVVNVSSQAGLRYTGKFHAAYDAAKAGLIHLTRTLAVHYGPKGIRLNTVIPGSIHTPLVEHRLAKQYSGGDLEKMFADDEATIPLRVRGDAWDVAFAALYLASDEAKFVTATEVLVDGGKTARCD
ncbi:MAG: SDR family oxidoreductase [Rhodospirillales bacterium]|nr:SDR family oxidoreductase [Rhodospirillales bacterium]